MLLDRRSEPQCRPILKYNNTGVVISWTDSLWMVAGWLQAGCRLAAGWLQAGCRLAYCKPCRHAFPGSWSGSSSQTCWTVSAAGIYRRQKGWMRRRCSKEVEWDGDAAKRLNETEMQQRGWMRQRWGREVEWNGDVSGRCEQQVHLWCQTSVTKPRWTTHAEIISWYISWFYLQGYNPISGCRSNSDGKTQTLLITVCV